MNKKKFQEVYQYILQKHGIQEDILAKEFTNILQGGSYDSIQDKSLKKATQELSHAFQLMVGGTCMSPKLDIPDIPNTKSLFMKDNKYETLLKKIAFMKRMVISDPDNTQEKPARDTAGRSMNYPPFYLGGDKELYKNYMKLYRQFFKSINIILSYLLSCSVNHQEFSPTSYNVVEYGTKSYISNARKAMNYPYKEDNVRQLNRFLRMITYQKKAMFCNSPSYTNENEKMMCNNAMQELELSSFSRGEDMTAPIVLPKVVAQQTDIFRYILDAFVSFVQVIEKQNLGFLKDKSMLPSMDVSKLKAALTKLYRDIEKIDQQHRELISNNVVRINFAAYPNMKPIGML